MPEGLAHSPTAGQQQRGLEAMTSLLMAPQPLGGHFPQAAEALTAWKEERSRLSQSPVSIKGSQHVCLGSI